MFCVVCSSYQIICRAKSFFYELSKRQKRNIINRTSDASTSKYGEIRSDTNSIPNIISLVDNPYLAGHYSDENEGSNTPTDLPICDLISDTDNLHETTHYVRNDPRRSKYTLFEVPTSKDKSSSFTADLRSWIIENSIVHSHANSLLAILRKHVTAENLPENVRTLLKTPRTNNNVFEVSPGHYYHFGIKKTLSENVLRYYSVNTIPDNILLNINVDGLPIAKSSGSQFWPILGSISANFETEPFIIGVYHGYHKPDNANEFLAFFVEEMIDIQNNGIEIQRKQIVVKLNAIICDSPARAFITCVKGHNAYFGCGKCTTEGEYVDGRVTYPQTNARLRTNDSFREKLQEEHHKDTPILMKLNVDMITNVPLDYMHLCCLGVMKRILHLCCRGPQNVRMNKDQYTNFSFQLLQMRSFIPREFSRKPRNLDEMDRFKATEFRQILLYTGLVLFKKCLRTEQYIHFLCFSLAIRILVSKDTHHVLNMYAQSLLEFFVK